MSNIDKQAIRDAAKEVIAEGGTAWFDEGQLSDKTGLDIPFTDAAFIASASPETVLALLDELEAAEKKAVEMPTFDGYVQHVARELQAAFRIACDNAGINIAAAGKGE